MMDKDHMAKEPDWEKLLDNLEEGKPAGEELSPLEQQQLSELSTMIRNTAEALEFAMQFDEDRNWKELHGKVTHQKMKLWPRIAVAAAMIIAVFGAGLFYFNNNKRLNSDTPVYANDIAPGGQGATLTLGNGKKIYINSVGTGKIAEESGIRISKSKAGELIYTIAGQHSSSTAFNTLQTAPGEQVQVRLPDGSAVFLNAASSLKYPVSFAALDKRMVTLSGEAYFEIAKDRSHPFIVKTNHQEVEVLGTHFNINSYADEVSTKTTLLEGSVRVSPLTGTSSLLAGTSASLRGTKRPLNTIILKQGQQSVLSGNNPLVVKEVDVEEVVAWQKGYFLFEIEDVESVMRKIARWYNVEIAYEGNIKGITIGGSVSRFKNVSEVLNMLSATKTVKFRVEGRTITVLPYN